MLDGFAKKIIEGSPLSIRYSSFREDGGFLAYVEKLDTEIQNWALVQSDFFSAEEWREIQLRKLKKILVHSGNNVNFWRKVFKESHFSPESISRFEDIQKLPVISRATLKSVSPKDLIARNISESRWMETATSGSTSEPFIFFNDRRDIFRLRANFLLELRYAGLPERSNVLVLGLGAIKGLRHYPLRVDDLQVFLSREWRVNKFYPFLNSARPEALFSTPSFIKLFVDFCLEDNFKYSFKGIRFYGEDLESDERRRLEDFFDCSIYSTYGSHECSIIGIECKERGLHTVPWFNYTEVVDDAGRPVPDGEAGNIVVTFFESECMPFIRYSLGDRGSILTDECGCGRRSPLLRFSGRNVGLMDLKNGDRYPAFFVGKYLSERHAGEVKKFQIQQNSPGQFILRLVPATAISSLRIAEIEENLCRKLGGAGNVFRVEKVDRIYPNANGKTPIFLKKQGGHI